METLQKIDRVKQMVKNKFGADAEFVGEVWMSELRHKFAFDRGSLKIGIYEISASGACFIYYDGVKFNIV